MKNKQTPLVFPTISVEQFVWLEAWGNVARADNCKEVDVATNWADNALKKFKERFKDE